MDGSARDGGHAHMNRFWFASPRRCRERRGGSAVPDRRGPSDRLTVGVPLASRLPIGPVGLPPDHSRCSASSWL